MHHSSNRYLSRLYARLETLRKKPLLLQGLFASRGNGAKEGIPFFFYSVQGPCDGVFDFWEKGLAPDFILCYNR